MDKKIADYWKLIGRAEKIIDDYYKFMNVAIPSLESVLAYYTKEELLAAVKLAESRNCELNIVNKLWSLYYK